MSNLIGQTLGQYEIIGQLGQGGMAVVYRAIQKSIKREVAIKVIETKLAKTQEFLARFEREAQTVASLSHAHILKVFDYGRQEEIIYLVMELLRGGSVSEMIGNGPLPLDTITRLLDQIASALDYAHNENILHRDLKPHNVLLDSAGNAFLTDFGIAKIMGEMGGAQLTQTGISMGTPAYMSPEQWQSAPLDGRSDIYSLGIMVYEMLSGDTPFHATTPYGVMHKHIYEPLPSLLQQRADLPEVAELVLQQATAKSRDDRFSTAGEFARVFKNALMGIPVDAPGRPGTGRNVSASAPPPPGSGPVNVRQAPITVRSSRTGFQQEPVAAPSAAKFPVVPVIAVVAVVAVVVVVILLAGQGGQPTTTPTPQTDTSPVAVNVTPSAPAATAESSTPVPTVPAASPAAVAALTVGQSRTEPKIGAEQVAVPAGCFKMGSDRAKDRNADINEQPQREVCITKDFWIDKYEVTNEAYQKFIDAGGYTTREYWSDAGWAWLESQKITGPKDIEGFGDPKQPRTGVSYFEAEAYAKWRGARLPTEAEWEYAARGAAGGIYPWGDAYVNGNANINETTSRGKALTKTAPVGGYENGETWAGAYDMIGNAWEWVADWFNQSYYRQNVNQDPPGPPSGSLKILRGGAYTSFPISARVALRQPTAPQERLNTFGFRLVNPNQ